MRASISGGLDERTTAVLVPPISTPIQVLFSCSRKVGGSVIFGFPEHRNCQHVDKAEQRHHHCDSNSQVICSQDYQGTLSGLLVTASIGGAVIPPLVGLTADHWAIRIAMMVPLLCFVYVLAVSVFGKAKYD